MSNPYDALLAGAAAPTDANPYDATIQGQRAQTMRVNALAGADANPDVEARVQSLAKRYGLPVEAVRLELPQVERKAKIDALDYDTLAKLPSTAALLENPDKARLALDDTENLSAIEQGLRFLGNTGKAFASAEGKLNEGLWGLLRAGGDLAGPLGAPVSGFAAEMGQAARARADRLMPKGDNVWSQGWYSGFQSTGMMAAQLPLAFAPGGQGALLASMGATTGGEAYGKARDQGVGVPQALAFGASQGVIEAGTERIGMPALFGLLKPGQFGTKALEYLIKDQGGEQITTALQDLNEWAVLPENTGETVNDYLAARPNAALQTAIATAVGGGAQVAGMKAVGMAVNRAEYQQARARQSEQQAQALAELTEQAKASKVLARDPATFETFIRRTVDGTPAQTVYIDGQTLMQSGLAEQVAAISPAVAEQVAQAAATGGTVAIPTEEYATLIAPTELSGQLLDHLRLDPDGFSRAEAQQFTQSDQGQRLQADLDRVVADAEQGDAFRASADAVKGQVRQQLDAAGRFTPQVNDTYAALAGAYYATRAAAMGVAPEALYARMPLSVVAEGLGGGVLNQGATNLAGTLAELEASGVEVAASEHAGVLTVSKIVVPEAERGAGRGTAAMRALLAYADRTGQHVALTPSADFGGDKKRLTQFYERLGFVQNKGKNRAFSTRETMYREAPGKSLYQGTPTDLAVQRWRDSLVNASRGRPGAVMLDTPTVLRELGVKVKALEFPQSYLNKVLDEHGDVPVEVFENLPALLSDPLMVVPHREGGLTVVIDARTDAGSPIAVGVREGRIRTVTPVDPTAGKSSQDRMAQWLSGAQAQGAKVYARNAEALAMTRASGEGLEAAGISTRIRQPSEGAAPGLIPLRRESRNRRNLTLRAHLVKRHGDNFYQQARGAYSPERLTIALLKGADLSTFLHEGGHFFFDNDIRLASEIVASQREGASVTPGEQQLLADVGVLLTWHGLKGDARDQLAEWHNMSFDEQRSAHERTAESFEAYLFEGRAPSIDLAPYFQRFRAWLLNVYRGLKEFLAGHPEAGKLTPEVRQVFDRMLASNDEILAAEQGRSMLPLFETAEQAGMQPEAWAAYQAEGTQASQDAAQDLQARGLRDLQWLAGARSRVLKKLQREAKAARDEAAVDVRQEVMAEPVYRAWRFLTGRLQESDRIGNPPEPPKTGAGSLNRETDSLLTAIAKLGGIARASAADHLGVHPDDFTRASGVFGKPLFRKEGGLSADAMAERLVSDGYLRAGEGGGVDLRQLEDLIADELGGTPQYSAFRDPSRAVDDMRAGEQARDPEALGAGRLDVASLREMYGRSAALEKATPTRRVSTFTEAAEKAEAFVGRALTNQATKQTATVSKGTLRKMLSASAARKSVSAEDHALAVANVDKLFEAAVLDHSHTDARAEPTIVAIHRFMAPMVSTTGDVVLVKLTVKETKGENQPNPLYSVEALDVKKPTREAPVGTGIERVPGTENGVAEHPTGGLSASVARLLAEVNDAASRTPDWHRLADLKMTATKGALHPDLVADLFGFTSGDHLVRTLLETTPPKDEIEARVDQRMLEQHGELATPEALARAADAAIHNEARGRMVSTELNALAKATGAPKVLAAAARQFAAATIARLKVRNLQPSQFSNAQARAARNAAAAMKKGDVQTAAAEKRNELLQHYSARAAHEAREEIDRGVKYLRKFDGDVKGMEAEYRDQITALLERFDLRQGTSLRAIDKRKTLAAWLQAQREAGMEPDVPPELQNEAYAKSYKDMTVEEFRGLRDAVKQIEHLGRLKHRLLTAKDQREYEVVRDQLVASIDEHSRGRTADTRTPATALGKALHGLKSFGAAHIKAATWARIMDGGRDGGPVWEYFVRPANERANQEAGMRADATLALTSILAPLRKLGKMGGKGQYFASIGRSLNREQRLAVALNIGNDGNLQRLLGGEGWTVDRLKPVLQSLTAQEWQAVQAIWDHFESYRPEIAAKERRVYGKEPAWVEPRAFDVTTADGQTVSLRGGYYPIKYDPVASMRAEQHADAEDAKRQLQGAYTSATTRRSFTKARVEEVNGRPLLYSLAGVYSGVNDVIHDLAWHEWLIDVNRLLRSDSIDRAIRNHYGPEVKAQLTSWVKDVAEGGRGAQGAGEMALGRLRQGISAAGLGFNVMSAVMQPLGLTQSIVRVGAPWVAKGAMKFIANPVGLARQVNEMSDFMANRTRTRFRELNELRNQVEDQTKARELVNRYTYWLMLRMQQTVDVPTWWGAYEKAIAAGEAEDRARDLADQAVIDSQGGGEVKDLSAIERGNPAVKLFTVFYSFMNTALNVGVTQGMTADTPVKRAKLAADFLLLYTVPALLGSLLKDALTPGGGDDDDEELARKLAAEQLSYLMGLFFVVREFGDAAKIVTGAKGARDYSGPAGVRFVGDFLGLLKQADQGEFDDAFRKALVNTVGDLTGLPGAQANRTITGVQALSEGETQNPAAIAFGFQKQR